jgi:hypothetical protein
MGGGLDCFASLAMTNVYISTADKVLDVARMSDSDMRDPGYRYRSSGLQAIRIYASSAWLSWPK